jgi:hypothetical protein
MKTKITFFVALMLVLAMYYPLSANKWRVCNVAGIIADFTGLQQANDASSVLPGDTVYLEGSGTSYGNVTINKKLIIIGPGFFLGDNDSTQANKIPSTIGTLIMSPGSEGSVLSGLTIFSYLYLTAGNIVLKHCNSSSINYVYSSNNMFIQSFLSRLFIFPPATNIIIKNNVIYAPNTEYALYMDDGTNAVIFNNVIQAHHRLSNADYRNNIFTGSLSSNNLFEVTGSCTIKNNISALNQYAAYADNLINQDMNAVFVCWNDCTGYGADNRFKLLLPTSPAIGYGYNGVDCGIFGGDEPYVLSGIPDFPAVWELMISGVHVTVKAKSH